LDEVIKKLGIEHGGVYTYDEQIFWIERETFLRMTILDSETRLIIIKEWVISNRDFNKNIIKRFLVESLYGIELKAVITDGYQSYPSIIEAFHKMHNLMLKIFKKRKQTQQKN